LDPVSVEPQSDALVTFCKDLTSGGAPWPPTEEMIARGLIARLPTGYPLTLDAVRQLCTGWGIAVMIQSMPQELRGFACSLNGHHWITISKHQTHPGADLHTLLHELREIVEHVFQELGLPTAASRDELEARAELFASMVRVGAYFPFFSSMLDDAEKIQSKFWRYGAYALIGVIGFFVSADAMLLPRFEDFPSRNLRT